MTDAADLLLPAEAADDLATYLSRARRVDPDGAVRLVGSGTTLAAYVSPVHGSGGPTVLGLRVMPLTQPADVDVTVPVAAVADRLARPASSGSVRLPLPPVRASATWAGVSPPRSGWRPLGEVDRGLLDAVAREGAAEIAAGAPEGSGASAVARLRAMVWGRDVAGVEGLPAGVAFVAEALGFLPPQGSLAVFGQGSWRRVSSARGHVLARRSLI